MQLATTDRTTASQALLERIEYLADRLSPTDLNVLISGEPGVGKRRLANRVFDHSKRRFEPRIHIHCADVRPGFLGDCVDETSIELNRRLSQPATGIEAPMRATLYLEEIGELEPSSQNTLLRLAEERELQRVTGCLPRLDVRLIATSSNDLREAAERGRFRKDLLYRLNVGHLQIPPLRQRKAELPRIFTKLLQRYARRFSCASQFQLDSTQWKLLQSYSWPGNDDELEDFVKSLVGLNDIETGFELLQQKIRLERKVQYPLGSLHAVSRLARNRAERRLIEGVLRQTGGDCARAAKILDVGPALLMDKIQELQIVTSVQAPEPIIAELSRARA